MKVCKTAQHPVDLSPNQGYTAAALHRLTRNEGASRAGRYLEGTCALAIRPRNR